MPNASQISCFMMGSQSRLIRCAEVLLEQNHRICGIISAEPSIQKWVKENELRLILPSDDLLKTLKLEPFDLFFSIDNFFKVPDEILDLPKMYAINFHDAPLPRYAGSTNARTRPANRLIARVRSRRPRSHRPRPPTLVRRRWRSRTRYRSGR